MGRKNAWISDGKSTSVKFRIWSARLGTRLLETAEFTEILWRSKILSLRDKSLRTPVINLTYYAFPCGDEILLKLVKSLIFNDQDCLRKRFFWIYAKKTHFPTKIILVEIKKYELSKVFNALEYFHFRFQG